MISSFRNWLDSRLGLTQIIQHALYEPIPSGARWRYITGSMLVFAFSVQAITGIVLWMCYSPSSQTAYESVYYIQHEMAGGWLVRGIHHFMAQAMVVVMGLHLLQVVVDGAYRAPREVNFWLGLVLMQIVMGLGLTGYLLPWDQKGFWATNVATNLATLVPLFGKEIQAVAIGGDEYGHHTLTRFFALHTGVLPAALAGFLALHIAVFRKHGIMAKITPGRPDQYFWPHQVLLDAVGCVVLLAIVAGFAIHWDIPGALSGNLPAAHQGAELGAPADPSEAYSAARPEWYFLFLFQLLKYFPGTLEIIGALIIPGILFTILVAMPIVGRWKGGHYFNVAFIIFLLLGAAGLTAAALREDYYAVLAPRFGWATTGSPAVEKLMSSSQEFMEAREEAELHAHRMDDLIQARVVQPATVVGDANQLSAKQLIPREGAVFLMRNDPGTRGQKLFEQHCSSCHPYAGTEGEQEYAIGLPVRKVLLGPDGKPSLEDEKPTFEDQAAGAPNLFGFATRAWIRGLLDPGKISQLELGEQVTDESDEDAPKNEWHVTAPYFGNTAHVDGRMANWVSEHAELLKDDPAKSDDDVDAIVAALSAQARLKKQAQADFDDKELITRGIGLIEQNCTSGCHRLGDLGQLGLAPDLTGYGSYEWMLGMISDPNHARFYGPENDRMPAFAADLDNPATNTVSPRELSLIVDWMRGEYYRPEDLKLADGEFKDEQYVAEHPQDLFPTWPHSAEQARLATRIARTVAEPRESVVGLSAPESPTARSQAEVLFQQNCAACHSLTNEYGVGIAARKPSAPNLYSFGSREWLTGLLDPKKVAGPMYFGNTSHFEGDMVNFVNDNLAELDDENKTKLADLIAAVSAEAELPAQKDLEAGTRDQIERGREVIKDLDFGGGRCVDCHPFRDSEDASDAPNLTGWGSRDWLVRFMKNPSHADFYGSNNDRMPAFGKEDKPRLTQEQLELLADLIRGELKE